MTSDDVCAVIGPKMWIGGEEGKYAKMLAGHKSQKTSGINVIEYLRAGWGSQKSFLFGPTGMCISFCNKVTARESAGVTLKLANWTQDTLQIQNKQRPYRFDSFIVKFEI